MLAVFVWFPGKTSFFVNPVRSNVCPGLITGYHALSWIVMWAQVQWGIPTGFVYQWPHKGLNQQPTSVWTGFQNVPATSIATIELKYPTQKALARPEILCQNEKQQPINASYTVVSPVVLKAFQSLHDILKHQKLRHISIYVHVYIYMYIYIYRHIDIL